ncbi:MAG: super-infection exclusion protein B [Methylovulum sp.]
MNDALSNGVIKGLILEDILYRSSSVSSPRHGFMSFAFNIQPWVWEYLNKHSYLLNHKNYKL